jgi:hypothetical protein
MTKKFKIMFDPINGDDPLEPDCLICNSKAQCRHKNTHPCTFDMLTS